MELVLTLLVVALLVVLPIAFFLFVIGGLFYSVYKAVIGDKKEAARSTPSPSMPPDTRVGDEIPGGNIVQANGFKGA